MAKIFDIEGEFVHLARIALAGRPQDVLALLQRTARRANGVAPAVSDALLGLLKEAPTRSSPLRRQSEIPLPVDVDSRLQLMKLEERPELAWEPIFVDAIESQLRVLVDERKKPDLLLKAGLEPTRTALFVGPPGVGKTMAARWLARELGRPLLILDLAAVMSSYLGRTGGNLRLVLDYAKSIDCVLLLDELDAVAKRRDDQGEIGELKRLVTVLIQQLDDWPSSNLLIAATNHSDLLDPAIWRRFETIVTFPNPDQKAIEAFVEQLLSSHVEHPRKWAQVLAVAMEGRSFSDIARDISFVRRQSAVRNQPVQDQLSSLIRADVLSKSARIALAVALVDKGVVSARRAGEITGVARDTIRSKKQPPKAEGNNAQEKK